MTDIANRHNLSPADNTPAPPRGRVRAGAEHLQYAGPDPRARSLRQGRSGIIAAVLEETVLQAFRDPVKIDFLDGIAQEIAGSGWALLLIPGAGGQPTLAPTALAAARGDALR